MDMQEKALLLKFLQRRFSLGLNNKNVEKFAKDCDFELNFLIYQI